MSKEDVPEGTKIIKSMYVLKTALHADGSIKKYKVRLVARGDLQDPLIREKEREKLLWLLFTTRKAICNVSQRMQKIYADCAIVHRSRVIRTSRGMS